MLGSLLLAHFAYVTIRGIAAGHPENSFWVSHFGTLIGGIGILLANRTLVSVALVSLLEGHLIWASDIASKWVTGHRWLGITFYLDQATWADWLQTINHFFSVPALLFVAYTQTGIKRGAWKGAAFLYAILLIVSATLLPAQANVNSAHGLWAGLERTPLNHLNSLPVPLYLASLVVLNVALSFWPSNWLLSRLFPPQTL